MLGLLEMLGQLQWTLLRLEVSWVAARVRVSEGIPIFIASSQLINLLVSVGAFSERT